MKTIQDNWEKKLNRIRLLASIVLVFMVVVDLKMDFKGWVRFGYTARMR